MRLRMRIGMMTDVYKPHVSGITNYISLNKEYLEKAGHEVFIFTFGDLDYADDEDDVVRSPGFPLTDTGYYLSFRYSRRAKALLQTMDLVHVHHPFLSGRLALNYCRPLRIPIVFTNHTRYDLYAQAYLPLLPEELSDTFLQTYMPTFCQAVDLVISPSAGMGEVLKKAGRHQFPLRSSPTAWTPALPLGLRRLPEGFRVQEEDILLIYSGRLGPEKNLDFLIHAFAGNCRGHTQHPSPDRRWRAGRRRPEAVGSPDRRIRSDPFHRHAASRRTPALPCPCAISS